MSGSPAHGGNLAARSPVCQLAAVPIGEQSRRTGVWTLGRWYESRLLSRPEMRLWSSIKIGKAERLAAVLYISSQPQYPRLPTGLQPSATPHVPFGHPFLHRLVWSCLSFLSSVL